MDPDSKHLSELIGSASAWVNAQFIFPQNCRACSDDYGIIRRRLEDFAEVVASADVRRDAHDVSSWLDLAVGVREQGDRNVINELYARSEELDRNRGCGRSHFWRLHAAKVFIYCGYIDPAIEIVANALREPALVRSDYPVGSILSVLREQEVLARLPKDALRAILQRAEYLPNHLRNELLDAIRPYLTSS